MELTHEFTVPASVDETWAALNDIESVAGCFPGATIASVDGDTFSGSCKVKLGPIALVYNGTGTFVQKDEASHTMKIEAKGKDKRGNGTAGADVTASLVDAGGSTRVTVVTELAITGKPAQFGRGVMVDVGNKLIGQFADCLAGKLAEPAPAEVAGGTAEDPDLPSGGVSSGADAASGGASEGADPASGGALQEGAEQEVAATLHHAEAANAERLGTADQDPTDQPADPPAEQPDAVEQAASGLDEPGSSPTGSAAPPAQRINGAAPAAVTAPAAAPPDPAPVAHRPPPRRPVAAEVEPIDLLSSAGPAVAKRLAAPVAALALLAVWLLVRRRR